VRRDADVSAEEAAGSTEVDQVAAARDWLRRHGVDPGEEPEVGPAAGHRGGGEVTDGPRTRPGRGALDEGERSADSSDRGHGGSGRDGRGRRGGRKSEVEVEGQGPALRQGARLWSDDPDADPVEVARGIVLRKLAVQARTRGELERALKAKDVPEEAATAVLDRMDEVGLVDDATFARDWVASRQQRRHLSKMALRRELQTKGVDRELIDDALADVEGADEHRAALDLARRRAASMGGLAREVAYRRLGGVLARRGFSSSITSRVLSEVLDGVDED